MSQELVFLPLGGVGEIGMNLALYGTEGRWLMVDCGITFADERLPGIDVIMADPRFIAERRETLEGLVLTHAHEDHLGAVAHLWPRLQCPVFATPFTAALLRAKLHEAGLLDRVPVTEVALGGRFRLGPFDIEYVTVTHSIPEPNSLAIRTPAGMVIHTGDWKLDPEPLIGPQADEARFRALGEEGVAALICDSTNVFREGRSGSEATVRTNLDQLVGSYGVPSTGGPSKGGRRVAIACFATNVARLETVARVAARHDRHASLVGRSLWRINEAARKTGYLADVSPFLTDHDGAYLPRDKVLYVCTGSQGEPGSALSRIAAGDHPHVVLEAGDVVIFSSRMIPGNEKSIGALQNRLAKQGVEVVTDREEFVHVSGHPAQDELRLLYEWTRPRLVVPVHGEARHLAAQGDLALAAGVPAVAVIENGEMLRLAPGPAVVVDRAPVGVLALDGSRLVRTDSRVLRHRHRMLHNGSAVVTLVVDREGGLMADPQISLQGLLDGETDGSLWSRAQDAVRHAVEGLDRRKRQEDDAVREAARLALRREMRVALDKKPITEVHLVRL